MVKYRLVLLMNHLLSHIEKKGFIMNIFKKIYCRGFQICFRIALPILPYRNPIVRRHISDIPYILMQAKLSNPMIVTDKMLVSLGAIKPLEEGLKENDIKYALFDGAYPNPRISLVEEAATFYKEHGCDSLIAFGGGSPMDLAKAVGVRIARPNTPILKLGGILKVHTKLPTIIAIPTTAGTGSETTLASVLIDDETKRKFCINDFPLIPRIAVLDHTTVATLPPYIAATTGLDALTHAVEAYIGRSTTKGTRRDAMKAVKLIYNHLDGIVNHTSAKSEKAMLLASHLAGRAFTRSYVGYVHAVSHSLSGAYNMPHGETNAIILPIMLRRYGKTVTKKLAKLSIHIGLGTASEGNDALAEKFIVMVENMNKRYGIPAGIKGIKEEDINTLAKFADKEANPLYPVPVLYGRDELEKIYREISIKE